MGSGPGRPRLFCRRSCRQRDYEARLRAHELGLGEHELVVAKEELEAVRDRIYLLSCALEDVEREIAEGEVASDDALQPLADAIRDCVST